MSKQLDLILVNPGGKSGIYQSLADDLAAIEPPVWCALLATFVRHKGHSVEIIDAAADDLIATNVGKAVSERNPRFVAVVVYGQQPSASTQVMTEATKVCYAVKAWAPDTKLVLLGGHVAALPDRSLKETDADYVCTGEGAYSLCDLLEGKENSLCRGVGYFNQAPESLRGIFPALTIHKMYFETKPAPNVADLDKEMPAGAWDLLGSLGKYRCHNWHGWTSPTKPAFPMLSSRSPYASIYTTLGCPYQCSFCCIQAPFKAGEQELNSRLTLSRVVGNSYRRWSPEAVTDQIDDLMNQGIGNLKIADEMFVLNKGHVSGICDRIIERGWGKALNIWAYARVDTCNDSALLDKLRAAGFRWLCLGIESGAGSVREGVDKEYKGGDEQIIACVKRIEAAGIHVLANYIFGLPDDDYDSMMATYQLAEELNTPWANFYSTMPYPGSKLWDDAKDHHELPWSAFSQHSYDTRPMATKHLTPTDVLAFRDQAFTDYFTRPEYLGSLDAKFGTGPRAEVEAMTRIKLERKLLGSKEAEVTA